MLDLYLNAVEEITQKDCYVRLWRHLTVSPFQVVSAKLGSNAKNSNYKRRDIVAPKL